MDDRCQTCDCLCKRLHPADKPAEYHFANLTGHDILTLMEVVVSESRLWHLDLKQADRNGHLSLKFRPKAKGLEKSQMSVDATVEEERDGTKLVFTYLVPLPCCDETAVVAEFSNFVRQALDVLACTNELLSARSAARTKEDESPILPKEKQVPKFLDTPKP